MDCLVCWNEVSKEIIEDNLRVVFKGALDGFELDFAFNLEEYNLKIDNSYDYIFVLCELNWENHTYSDMYGISLVKEKIRFENNTTPVVFFSMLSHKQIIKIDPTNEIIATYILGQHFVQLPLTTDEQIELLKKMKPLTPNQLLDIQNFCSVDKMIANLRHDVNYSYSEEDFSKFKNKLIAIIKKQTTTSYNQEILKINEFTLKDIVRFKSLCDKFEMLFTGKEEVETQEKYNAKVLILDDNKSDNLNRFISNAKEAGIDIHHKTKTSEAIELIKEDISNSFDVILIDFRIWNKEENNGLMLEQQGYEFIEYLSKLNRVYSIYTFSDMPRDFRLQIGHTTMNYVIPKSKSFLLENEDYQKTFFKEIDAISRTSDIRKIADISNSEVFIEFHKVLYNNKEREKLFREISDESERLIDLFYNTFSDNIDYLTNDNNDFAQELKKIQYKSEFYVRKSDAYYFNKWFKNLESVINSDAKKKNEIKKIIDGETSKELSFIINNFSISDIKEEAVNEIFKKLKTTTVNSIGKKLKKLHDGYDIDFLLKLYINQILLKHTEEVIIYNRLKNSISKEQNKIIKEAFYNKDKREHLSRALKNILVSKTLPNSNKEVTENTLPYFIRQLIIRRVAIYVYYWVESNVSENFWNNNFNKTPSKITRYIDRLFKYGFIKSGDESPSVLNKNLYLTPPNGHLNSFKDIVFTPEEKIFFRRFFN